jgi:NADPH:quinone reductase-like Zn-dependent oxidoreductase
MPTDTLHFIDTNSSDIRKAVLELTDGRGADLALDTVGGALFEPALRILRFDGRLVGIFSAPEARVDFPVSEIYSRQPHVTELASVFMDGPTRRASSTSSVRCPTAASLLPRP